MAFPKITTEMLQLLSPKEQELFLDSLERLVGGESLRDYIARITPNEPVPHHHSQIIDAIEYARLKPVRIVFDMPPGHAKTTILLKSVAWWLTPDHSPADLCAYVTYSDAQARDKSRIAKEWIEESGGLLSASKNSDGYWLTPQGGGLVAKGSKGGLMGKRIPGILLYDDPYKDMQEARSQSINSMIIERFKAAAFTRLQGGSIFVMHTRWRDDDLIGYILKNLGWDQVHIPAVCNEVNPETGKDALGRTLGEVAWPEKYPYEICSGVCSHDGHLAEIRKTIGEHLWAALYQGSPRPEGQAMFHEPARYKKSEFTWTGKRGCIVIDPAATAKNSADWSVLLVLAIEGYGTESRMWIVDRVRVQVEIPELIKIAKRMQRTYKLMIACEAIGGFKAVPQSLRAMDPTLRVLDITTGSKDKFTRALGVAAAWNDGRVLVPMDEECDWADQLIDEYTRFTGNGDAHDDQVDAGAHGWNVLYRLKPKITESDYAQGGI